MRISSTLSLLLLLLTVYIISAKKWELCQAIISSLLWVIWWAKNEAELYDERRRNQMVAKASIYFF
jgi:hypothetical protein